MKNWNLILKVWIFQDEGELSFCLLIYFGNAWKYKLVYCGGVGEIKLNYERKGRRNEGFRFSSTELATTYPSGRTEVKSQSLSVIIDALDERERRKGIKPSLGKSTCFYVFPLEWNQSKLDHPSYSADSHVWDFGTRELIIECIHLDEQIDTRNARLELLFRKDWLWDNVFLGILMEMWRMKKIILPRPYKREEG